MEIRDKRILVLGMGKTGLASAKTLAALGGEITISDARPFSQLTKELKELEGWPINKTKQEALQIHKQNFSLVVTSPGIPPWAEPIRDALKAGIPVLSEIEMAYQLKKNNIIAITGTNGKTTTTELVGQMLKDGEIQGSVAGNIGIPLIAEVNQRPPEHLFVVEVSSYQLEWIKEFRPKISVLTNLTPDHLDRHGTMENYLAAKARVFQNQQKNDFVILNYDDPAIKSLAEDCPAQVIFFSRRHKLNTGVYISQGHICVNLASKEEKIISVKRLAMPGFHNLENALAAIGVGYLLGLSGKAMKKTLETFPGVPHRLEKVAVYQGVEYINDSKGTNPEAAIRALDAFHKPIVLIAGGSSKGKVDFSSFGEKIKEKVRELVLVGDTAQDIMEAVKETGFKNISIANSFVEAVSLAAKLAKSGEVVLLSPACASFDFFRDFEHRGEVFKELVQKLISEY